MKGHRWLGVYSLGFDSNELKDRLMRKMRHPYVDTHIQKPFIDDEKIFILNELYKQIDLPNEIKKQSITTILLVQIALDTHELIPAVENNQMSESEIQLSVLAGDYYSGLYYLLLAEMEDIDMIRILANSIKQINEYKMNLYYGDASSLDILLKEIKYTEASLFINVANYLGFDKSVVELIGEVLLISRLQKEIQTIREKRHSYIYQFAQHQNKAEQCMTMILEELSRLKDNVNRLLEQLPYSFQLKDYVKEQYGIAYNTTMAEEG